MLGTRFIALSAGLCTLLAAPLATAGAQQSAYRFEVTGTTDTTITFPLGEQHWVKRGMTGIAVDPRRRDALIARFAIVSVESGNATALVTGQTAPLSMEHVALLERPKRKWYQDLWFWIGTGVGAAVGVLVAKS